MFIESPANPLLEITDIAAVAAMAREVGAKVLVDNVFATPIFQKPLKLGADIVIYSATKHIDGQGRVLGGAILGDAKLLDETYRDLIRHTGPALSPFNAWVLLNGLVTLDLRVRAQSATAATLADRIAAHRKVKRTRYPGRADHPQHEVARRQLTGGGNEMIGGGNLIAFDLGDQAGGIQLPQRAAGGRHLQQPRRRPLDGHPPHHHDAPLDDRGGAAGNRPHSRLGAAERRAGRRRRSGARYRGGAGQGVGRPISP